MARRAAKATQDGVKTSEALPPSLSPLGLVKAVFTHHVRIKRAARGLVVVLEAETPLALPGRSSAAPHGDSAALAMHAGLSAALNAAPLSRQVFKHLAAIEHKLWHGGSLFLHDLPLSVLQRVIKQLDGVTGPSSTKGLALLRERLTDAIGTQQRLQREQEMRAPPSSFFVDHKLEVAEATPSDFAQAIDERATDVPPHWGS